MASHSRNVNLRPSSLKSKTRRNSSSGDDHISGRVRVVVRLRPQNAEETVTDADFPDCVQLQPELKRLKLWKNSWDSDTYEFDEVLTEFASQKRVYEVVAKPVVKHCHLIGHQPDKGFMRKMQQANPVPLQRQDEPLDRIVLVPDLSGSQLGTRVRTVYNNDTQIVRPPSGFQTGFDQQVARGDTSKDIDEICDENIQLFMRCEQYAQRENELKTTVADLENQVAETKRKCAELSSRVELLSLCLEIRK